MAFSKNDRVLADFDGEWFPGTVTKRLKTVCVVEFDDGETHRLKHVDLRVETDLAFDDNGDLSEDTAEIGKGFNQYAIQWKSAKGVIVKKRDQWTSALRFSADVDGARFWGQWRVASGQSSGYEAAWCIDIWVERNSKQYSVKSIPYYGADPRATLDSMNADLCAVINQWLFAYGDSEFENFDLIVQSARYPVVKINRLATIDELILKLKEFRDLAIQLGGERAFKLRSDNDDDPAVTISINVTNQAIALKGRPPSLIDGSVFDGVTGKKGVKGTKLKMAPEATTLQTIIDRYHKCTPEEQRALRGTMRKMGVKGGLQGAKKMLASKEATA